MGTSSCTSKQSIETKEEVKIYPLEKVSKQVSRIVSRRNSTLRYVKIDQLSSSSNYSDKFEYLSVLGNSKFGKVKLYKDKKLNSMKYAIKTLLKKHYYLDEINNLKCLDHPNIVKYFKSYEEKHQLHIVMEYIHGETLTLHEQRRKENKFNERNLADIAKCILKVLNYLSNKQIVHRDLKPDNILFSVPGKII